MNSNDLLRELFGEIEKSYEKEIRILKFGFLVGFISCSILITWLLIIVYLIK